MDKYEIIKRIENFAPLDTAEKWDCCGWLVETSRKEVHEILLALTVTKDIFEQAQQKGCDMIISHHPLFEVPLEYKNIDIYCAHTNMDLAQGGTTDTLIASLAEYGLPIKHIPSPESFVRYVDTDIEINKLLPILAKVSPKFRYTNNTNQENFKKIAFCAGSGSEFISEAFQNGADAFVTGDLKFHTALDSPIVVFDLGHFETEIQILDVFKDLIGQNAEVIKAEEQSPFISYS